MVSGWCAVPLTVIDAGADCRRNLLSDRMLVESTVRSLLTLVGTDTAVQL